MTAMFIQEVPTFSAREKIRYKLLGILIKALLNVFAPVEDSGSDEDFMVEDDDDDSDYGRPKRKNSKVSRRSKDKKSPKSRIRTSGISYSDKGYVILNCIYFT